MRVFRISRFDDDGCPGLTAMGGGREREYRQTREDSSRTVASIDPLSFCFRRRRSISEWMSHYRLFLRKSKNPCNSQSRTPGGRTQMITNATMVDDTSCHRASDYMLKEEREYWSSSVARRVHRRYCGKYRPANHLIRQAYQ